MPRPIAQRCSIQPFFAQASGRDVFEDEGQTVVVSQDTGRNRENEEYRYAITTDRWKYLRIEEAGGGVRDELYDLVEDPYELREVSEVNAGTVAKFAQLLDSTLEDQRSRADAFRDGKPPETREMSADLAKELQALGYAAGSEENGDGDGGDDDGE